MMAWVLFVADFVKKLVHERELRLHEVMLSIAKKKTCDCNHVLSSCFQLVPFYFSFSLQSIKKEAVENVMILQPITLFCTQIKKILLKNKHRICIFSDI